MDRDFFDIFRYDYSIDQKLPEEFASKMVWVIDHPQEAETIGRKGAEVALREFNYLTESKKIIDTITRDKQ